MEDSIREWNGLEFAMSQRVVGEQGKVEDTGCEIICGAPTILAVKGKVGWGEELAKQQRALTLLSTLDAESIWWGQCSVR